MSLRLQEPRSGPSLDIEELLSNSIIVDKDLIVELYMGFEKLLRFVGGLLYTSAKKAGEGMAERMRQRGLLGEGNAADVLFWSFVVSGYAEEVEIVKVELKGKETRLEVHAKGTLLGSRLKSKKPVDQPLAGFLAGWLEKSYGARVDARETACQARGDPACVFEIKIKKRVDELKQLEGKRYSRSELTRSKA
ncbi:MAG: hypothetical protein GXO15_01780 [Crenarchaeota archaeon]|nr:hypothetical protein [Thermoproteota archaeon]